MQPIIYIDMLFLLNYFMDTIVLFSTSLLLKKHISLSRLLSTAGLSAIYSVVMFFPKLTFLCSGIFKILFLALIAYIAFPSKKVGTILKTVMLFLSANFIYGGVMFFLIFATDFGTTSGATVSNGEIYLNISFATLLISAILSFSVTAVISYIKKKNIQHSKTIVDLTIVFENRQLYGKALCDTGCSLSDPISGRPAIIISPDFAKKILPSGSINAINPKQYRILPYRTIDNQKSFLYGFISDKIIINGNEIKNITIALSKHNLTDFDAIINSELTENIIVGKAVNTHNETETYV